MNMNKGNNRAIIFKDEEHEMFYRSSMPKCGQQDVYHKALVYCLGISGDTRRNVDRIFDFKKGSVKPKCLEEGWITSGSARVVRMAFNLFCNGTPSVRALRGKQSWKSASIIRWKICSAVNMQYIFGKRLKCDIRNTAFR